MKKLISLLLVLVLMLAVLPVSAFAYNASHKLAAGNINILMKDIKTWKIVLLLRIKS